MEGGVLPLHGQPALLGGPSRGGPHWLPACQAPGLFLLMTMGAAIVLTMAPPHTLTQSLSARGASLSRAPGQVGQSRGPTLSELRASRRRGFAGPQDPPSAPAAGQPAGATASGDPALPLPRASAGTPAPRPPARSLLAAPLWLLGASALLTLGVGLLRGVRKARAVEPRPQDAERYGSTGPAPAARPPAGAAAPRPGPPPRVAMATLTALKGQDLNKADFASADTVMQFAEVDEGQGTDRLPATYDIAKIEAYFAKRPLAVSRRLTQVATALGGFAVPSLLKSDAPTQQYKNARAARLCDVLTSLGPFYIKLGQVLSIRPDLISDGEMQALQKLCDKVPAFDNALAMRILERELGPIHAIFDDISPEPVAAASLGQVYKARLKENGQTVAVKIQRPSVLETVALDLYICRFFGEKLNDVRFLEFLDNSDLVALVDEFAGRLYRELDYRLECESGLRVKEDLKDLPNVVVPFPYRQHCTKRVHVAEWIEGEKLASSMAPDVKDLVLVGIVAYLTQLLGTGFFHADPHPGNLIRTADGRLAILDFGLMLEIEERERYGIIECVAHLVHRDYERIGDDLVTLGFLPPGQDISAEVPRLARVFDMALAGGGAKSMNFNKLASDLAGITYNYGGRLPPFFALLIRAIGVLEGIALVSDPNFAIIKASYPYVAERLLTDPDPRVRGALRYMLYGDSDALSVDRVIDMVENVNTFAAVSSGQATETGEGVQKALLYVFSPSGDYVRGLLLDEVAGSLDAMNRDALWELARRAGVRELPDLLGAMAPELDARDRRAVDNMALLLGFARGQMGFEQAVGEDLLANGQKAAGIAQKVQEVWPQIADGLQDFAYQVVSLLATKQATRMLRFGLGSSAEALPPAPAAAPRPALAGAAAAAPALPPPAPARAPPAALPVARAPPRLRGTKILTSGASTSLDFDIPIVNPAWTPVDFYSDEKQILLTSLKDPNELIPMGDEDGWVKYKLNPAGQQFLFWRIAPIVYIQVKLEVLDQGTPQERIELFMKSDQMELGEDSGFVIPDEVRFSILGSMEVKRQKGMNTAVAHVTGTVDLGIEAEVLPDSGLYSFPTQALSDAGTALCETILRNVAGRMQDTMSQSYQDAVRGAR